MFGGGVGATGTDGLCRGNKKISSKHKTRGPMGPGSLI